MDSRIHIQSGEGLVIQRRDSLNNTQSVDEFNGPGALAYQFTGGDSPEDSEGNSDVEWEGRNAFLAVGEPTQDNPAWSRQRIALPEGRYSQVHLSCSVVIPPGSFEKNLIHNLCWLFRQRGREVWKGHTLAYCNIRPVRNRAIVASLLNGEMQRSAPTCRHLRDISREGGNVNMEMHWSNDVGISLSLNSWVTILECQSEPLEILKGDRFFAQFGIPTKYKDHRGHGWSFTHIKASFTPDVG